MGVYIKNWSLANWKELLRWAKIGANNAMIGEFAEVEEIPPHGRLIDAAALMREMHNVILEDGEDRRTFYSVIERQPTIIPAEEGE